RARPTSPAAAFRLARCRRSSWPAPSSPPSTSCPTRASASSSRPTPAGPRFRSSSSTASSSAAPTSSPSSTRRASWAEWWRRLPDRAAVVGAGVIGLSAARALAQDGFDVTVYERDRAGSPLGSSPARSRIFRRSYREVDYLRLSLRAIEEWRRLDPSPLRQTGLLEYGQGGELHAAAMDEVGETYEWLEPAEAERRFPEARFPERALWD